MDYRNEPHNLDGGFSKSYTIEELIDLVNMELTMDCALPQILPTRTIRRVILTQAQPWFYQNYRYAVQQAYYLIHRGLLETEEFTRYKWIYLPAEIQSVTWLYKINRDSLYELGLNAPNLSINLGVTNQPYLSSYVTTIGELGVYKTVLDNFSDMLNHFNLFTVKYDYNQMSNRLNILSAVREHLIAECYVNIEPQHLYADPLFIDYIIGISKMKIGEMVGRFDFKLPGNVTYNSQMMLDEGRQLKDKVEETIKGMASTDFFFMVKK
jgi:hypothetical protein